MPPVMTHLDEAVAALAPQERARFDRLYAFAQSTARIVPPEKMEGWIAKTFRYLGPTPQAVLDVIRHQPITHVVNRATGQATLFNAVRSQRPMEATDTSDIAQEVERSRRGPFCRPLELTPANTFGRVPEPEAGADTASPRRITAANVAAYDGWHGLVIFEDHDPLRFRTDKFQPEEIADLFATARAWADKAHAEDPQARFFLLMWNCLWKAGASIIHGHAQMVVGRKFHYGRVERLRQDARRYATEHEADYFDDLIAVHEALGLADRCGRVAMLAHLTPTKERELVLVAPSYDDPDLPKAVWRALKTYAALDVKAYNLAVHMPPLGDPDPAWDGFPTLVYLVDRGDPSARTTDVAGMELYASTVVSADPFAVAETLRRAGA